MPKINNTFCFIFFLTKQNSLFYIVITQNVLSIKKAARILKVSRFYSKSEISMNIKTNVVKPMCTALGVMGMLTAAYAFSPAKEQEVAPLVEQIEVTAPFKLESINVKSSKAAVETLNEQYVVEFEYVADFSTHSNSVGYSWNEVEVKEILEPRIYDENGEVANYYLSTDSVQEIVQVIEQELRKPA